MATKLEIIIEAQMKGRALKDVRRDLRAIEEQTQRANAQNVKFRNLLGGLAIAGAAAAVAIKEIYATAKEGAALDLASQQFEKLSQSIDTTADSLMGRLRDATNGLVSDAQLVASASQIINLGLGKTEDQVVRLATVVGALGVNMDVLTLTLANQSTMRLDSLGLSIEGVTRKQKELQAQGMSTADAFNEAVISGLEEKMVLLGETSETTAGKMQILETALINAFDEIKKGTAEAVEPLIDYTAGIIEAANQTDDLGAAYKATADSFLAFTDANEESRDRLIDFAKEAAKTAGSVEDFYQKIDKAGISVELFERAKANTIPIMQLSTKEFINQAKSIAALESQQDQLNEQITRSSKETKEYSIQQQFIERALSLSSEKQATWNDDVYEGQILAEKMANSTEKVADSVNETVAPLDDSAAAALRYRDALGELNGRLSDYFTTAMSAGDTQTDFNQLLFKAAADAGAPLSALASLGTELGIFTDEQAEAWQETALFTERANNLAGQLADGLITWEQYIGALDTYKRTLTDDTIPTTDTASQKIIDMKEAAQEFADGSPYSASMVANVSANWQSGTQQLLQEFGAQGFLPSDDQQAVNQSTTNNVTVNVPVPISPGMGNTVGSQVANVIGQQGAR